MPSNVRPWWSITRISGTWWSKRHTAINLTVVVALLLFMLWKSFR
jgi:hypothetical protein